MLPQSVLAEAAKQRGLITRKGLKSAGLDADDRRELLKSGSLVHVFPGVYRLGEFAEMAETRWLAACLWNPRAVLSHRTAAALYEFLEPGPGEEIDLVAPGRRGHCPEGIRLIHTFTLPEEDRRVVRGFPVTSKARTLVDLAKVMTEEELAYPMEAALRKRIVPLDWLQRRLRQLRAKGREGVAKLARLVEDVETRGAILESALEVRFWRRIRDAGFPLPHCQHPVDDGEGLEPLRIDFAWPGILLAVETRGAKDHGSVEGFEKNSRRTARLSALGWSVMPVTWSMMVEDEARVLRQVASALRVRGGIPPSQLRLL
jgi:very-short-patch-repair endonuclease